MVVVVAVVVDAVTVVGTLEARMGYGLVNLSSYLMVDVPVDAADVDSTVVVVQRVEVDGSSLDGSS